MKNKLIIYYAIILLALTIVNQMFTSYNYSYYVDEAALITLQQASLAKIIFLCFDGLNDLLFGYLSDKFSFKKGKRKTWLIFGLPLLSASFLFTFAIDAEMNFSTFQFFLYYIFITIMFDNFSSLMYVNYNALFPLLFQTNDERTKASSLKHLLEIIGAGIVLLTAPILKERIGYLNTCLIYVLLMIFLMSISLMHINEPDSFSSEPVKEEKFTFKNTWQAVFQNKAFIWYLISTASFLTILGTLITILPFLIKYTMKISGIQQTIITALAFIVVVFSLKGWTKLIKKKGHRYAYQWSFYLLPLVIFVLSCSFNFWSTLIAVIVCAPFIGGLLITPDLMMADIIDEDFRKHHVRREAALMSISSFVRRLALIVAAVILMLVSSFGGYQDGSNPGANPEVTFRIISMVFLPLVALIGTIAAKIYLKLSAAQN